MAVIADLMTEDPRTVRETASIREALEILQTMDFRHLPVVNGDGELVGVVSDRDLRALLMPRLVDTESMEKVLVRANAPVASIMSSDVVSVAPDDDVQEAIDCMLDEKVGAVPVVDADQILVGIVSYVDVLRHLSAEA